MVPTAPTHLFIKRSDASTVFLLLLLTVTVRGHLGDAHEAAGLAKGELLVAHGFSIPVAPDLFVRLYAEDDQGQGDDGFPHDDDQN